MNPNYQYPKNEIEFYSRPYSVDQLVKNYDFNHLMAYYLFGMSTLQRINLVIDNGMYNEVGRSADEVYNDQMFFTLRTAIVKNAMAKIYVCEIILVGDKIMVLHNN
jgi:hypothetical protein